jgi:putative membrane protein
MILTVAIIAAAYLLEGIEVSGFFSAFLAAAILGILNALFRPVLLLITLPVNILTLGLFTFVINALMLMMASGVIGGFLVHGFWTAVLGSVIISLVSALLTTLISERGDFEIILLKKRDGRWE